MIINGNKINIFDPDYAFSRITQGDTYYTDNKYSALEAMIESQSPYELKRRLPYGLECRFPYGFNCCPRYGLNCCSPYELKCRSPYELRFKTGDEFEYRERSYHKYPNNIAVLIENNGVFGLQTFSDSKIGEYYADVLESSHEVYKFFMRASADIIVLENIGGRELPKSYDLLISFISKINTARKNFEENSECINHYIDRLNSLLDEQKYYPNLEMGALFKTVVDKAEKFLVGIQGRITEVNQTVQEELEEMYCTPSNKEKDCIAFGLYYGFLKGFQFVIPDSTKPNRYTPFMREMHTFIKEHKGIVDDYCKYMDYSPYECEVVKQLIHDEGLNRDRWIYAADDLL